MFENYFISDSELATPQSPVTYVHTQMLKTEKIISSFWPEVLESIVFVWMTGQNLEKYFGFVRYWAMCGQGIMVRSIYLKGRNSELGLISSPSRQRSSNVVR